MAEIRVLVVDDDPASAWCALQFVETTALLLDVEVDVETSPSVRSARTWLRDSDFNLVVASERLPGVGVLFGAAPRGCVVRLVPRSPWLALADGLGEWIAELRGPRSPTPVPRAALLRGSDIRSW